MSFLSYIPGYYWFADPAPAETEDERFIRVYRTLSYDRACVAIHYILQIFSILVSFGFHITKLDQDWVLGAILITSVVIMMSALMRNVWPVVLEFLLIKWGMFAFELFMIWQLPANSNKFLLTASQLLKLVSAEVGCFCKSYVQHAPNIAHISIAWGMFRLIMVVKSKLAFRKIEQDLYKIASSSEFFGNLTYFVILDAIKVASIAGFMLGALFVYGLSLCKIQGQMIISAIVILLTFSIGRIFQLYKGSCYYTGNYGAATVVRHTHETWTTAIEVSSFPDWVVQAFPFLHRISLCYVGCHFLENESVLNYLSIARSFVDGIDALYTAWKNMCQSASYASQKVYENRYAIGVASGISAVMYGAYRYLNYEKTPDNSPPNAEIRQDVNS